ncbi:hypothetical protein [Actinomadura sp. 7K507]|uniref:hypothetical protein n=1 Tax=Actinomadura sp. 7K507 TaxID=2530365 RepID=UPI00104F0AD8|nr:hypothetical protein [Actinomadura sp. 7K507]TDC77806.1 hypothetical protein E1285_38215 [Actinomadura sp. 7K507]
MRSRRTALRGAAVVVTAAAGAVAVPAAAAAYAATGQVPYSCTIFGTTFDYNATVTLTAPATAGVGDEVTVEADFSNLPGVAPVPVNKWTTSGSLTLSGAQTGSVDITVPEKAGPIPPYGEVPIGTATGTFTIGAAGDVKIAPGDLSILADAGAQATIACAPKGTPEALATISVGATGGPSVSVNPPSVAQGGGITLSGAGWQPGAVDVALCDANGAQCAAGDLTGVSASVDAGGELTGSATVAGSAATGSRTVVITQGAVSKSVALRVTGDAPPPTGECEGQDAEQCDEQKINLIVNGGPLTMAREAGEVDLTPVTLNGTEQTATGDLREVTVVDARGGTAGWSLTGVLSDFSAVAGTKIPAGNMSWTPSCTPGAGSSTAVPGSAGALDPATAATLCSAPDGAGQIVGGTFTAGAGLNLKVPPVTGAGQYTAVLTLTLS